MIEPPALRADRLSSDMALSALEVFFDSHDSQEEAAGDVMLLVGAIEMASHKLALRALALMAAAQEAGNKGESDE